VVGAVRVRQVGLKARLRRSPGTIAILTLVTAVSLVEFALGQSAGWDWVTRALGGSIQDISHGQVWRLLTPALVNPPIEAAQSGMASRVGIAVHFLPNVVLLWIFGTRLEARLGTARLLTVAVASEFFGRAWLAVPFPRYDGHGGGTSIMLSGVAGALFMLVWSERHDGPRQRKKVWLSAGLFAIALITAPGLSAGNNHAHAAGFVAGAAIGYGARRQRFREGVGVVALVALAIVALRVTQLRT
jgi:membrane associated rhomboid family serine protease